MRSSIGHVVCSALLAAGGAGVLRALVEHLIERPPVRTPDAAVEIAVLALGGAMLAWYVLTACVSTACWSVRVWGRCWRLGEQGLARYGAPILRTALSAGAGTALVAGSLLTPAAAQPADPEPAGLVATWHAPTGTDQPADPDSPDPNPADSDAPDPNPADPESPDPEPADPDAPDPEPADSQVHVVQPGQSLWTIAAQHLGPQASETDIAAWWPLWHTANSELIGSDPDLIHPGQTLQIPERTAR